jgi:hypothetical protein
MKKKLVFLAMLAMVLAFGLAVVGCGGDGDDDGGGTWDAGKGLKGTSWEYRDTYSGSIISNDYATTITFTSDDALTIKVTGWVETTTQVINGYNITYVKERTNVNDSYTGTYTYYSNIKEGFMNSNYWAINPWNFRILSDNKTMAGKLDANQFTKK